jgi:hypothetical protein
MATGMSAGKSTTAATPLAEPSTGRPAFESSAAAAAAVSLASLVVTAALVIAVAASLHGFVRLALALAFLSFVPGWAIVATWRPPVPRSWPALSIVLSLTGLGILATLSVFVRVWHPIRLFYLEALVSAVAIVVDLLRRQGFAALSAAFSGSAAGLSGSAAGTGGNGASAGSTAPAGRFAVVGSGASAGRSGFRLQLPDALLVVAMILFAVGASTAGVSHLDSYGLASALPFAWYAGLAVLVVSTAILLLETEISRPRLALHVTALVFMLHGTPALVFRDPIYAWLYKLIGVVGYIDVHGAVNQTIDIYQNWPGFFALAAWGDHVAGVVSPLTYAAWAPVFFNLAYCVVLKFALRPLPLSEREQWMALLLFVAGNWVGQDYFSPQAMAFLMSLGVFAIVLNWLSVNTKPGWVVSCDAWLRKNASFVSPKRDANRDAASAVPGPDLVLPVTGALVALLAVDVYLVLIHQITPYVVVFQVAALTLFGLLKPRWLVWAMAAIAVAYLAPRFNYVNHNYHIFSSIAKFLHNLSTPNIGEPTSLWEPGRRLTDEASLALSLGLWAIGIVGVVRRRRQGRSTLNLALLAAAPALLVFFLSYGGEGVLRVYLFSLPWTATLAASALEPGLAWNPAARWASRLAPLLLATALVVPATFFPAETNVIPPGEVAASNYFYTHAPRGTTLVAFAHGFPIDVNANYAYYGHPKKYLDPNLLTNPDFFRTPLCTVSAVNHIGQEIFTKYDFAAHRTNKVPTFLVLAPSEYAYAESYGFETPSDLASLSSALMKTPTTTFQYTVGPSRLTGQMRVSLWYQTYDTKIFKFTPVAAGSVAVHKHPNTYLCV